MGIHTPKSDKGWCHIVCHLPSRPYLLPISLQPCFLGLAPEYNTPTGAMTRSPCLRNQNLNKTYEPEMKRNSLASSKPSISILS